MTHITISTPLSMQFITRPIRTVLTLAVLFLTIAAAIGCSDNSVTPTSTADQRETPAASATSAEDDRAASEQGTTPPRPESATAASTTMAPQSGDGSAEQARNNQPQSTPAQQPGTQSTSPTDTQDNQSAITAEGAAQAQQLYTEAETYLIRNRFHRAEAVLDETIALNPDLAEAYTLRGFARTMTGNHQAGIQDLDTAIEMQAKNISRAHSFRSFAHSQTGNYDAALDDADKARESMPREDDLRTYYEVDAALAKFTAQYRSGDYGAAKNIQYELGDRPPRGSYQKLEQGLEPYGLNNVYPNVELHQYIDQISELDTRILLNPEDVYAYAQRAGAHATLIWHAMAVDDYTTYIDLLGNEAEESVRQARASAWASTGDFDAILQHAESLDPSSDPASGVILALAHWRTGNPQKAAEVLDALDYADPTALFRLRENQRELRYENSPGITAHLAFKGALAAARGDLEQGLKYLNVPVCNDRIVNTRAEERPEAHPSLHDAAMRPANTAFRARLSSPDWQLEQVVKTWWEWCDYPAELISNPTAGAYVTMALPTPYTWALSAQPTQISYQLRPRDLTDPIVIASDNPDLLHYMAAWSQLALNNYTAIITDIDRAIDLDPAHAASYRIKAEIQMSWANNENVPPHIFQEDEQAMSQQQYDASLESYATYESLASPMPWEAARYHFARGRSLHYKLQQKQEAQAAYQQAFQLGYSEEAVKEALNQLNQ